MRSEIRIGLLVIVILALAIILSGSIFTVLETEQVIITQFGKPVGKPISTPGLKMKVPFIQKVHAFDKRFLEFDGDANQVPTADKRFIWVDTYARWRITYPLLFFQRLHNERGAQSRLDDIIDGETRNTIAKHQLIDIVRSSNRPFVVSPDLVEAGEVTEAPENVEFGREALTAEVLA
ncbi:MAG: SPFH domain-containing protein, partial [Thermoanaerobaculia bacterium]